MQAETLSKHKSPRGASPDRLLTGPDVQTRYQKSHVTIWRWINSPDLGFPPPLRISRMNYWRLADLEAWESKLASRQ
jgi:predicted DNA-binding transcriptional regulator AlpA